jgi:hypothetical protein
VIESSQMIPIVQLKFIVAATRRIADTLRAAADVAAGAVPR